MSPSLRIGLAAAIVAIAGAAAAQDAAPAPDGKALYRTKTCVACHGKDGAKAIQMYPDLAGQDAKYLLQQMNEIADGKRVSGNDERGYPRTQGMKDIMHLTSPEERAKLAEWLASLPPPKPRPLDPAPDAARLEAGKKAYVQGACQTCHGADGMKPTPSYPVIGGHKREYAILQMKEIRDGIRQNGRTKLMLPFAKKLDDAKIELIADYLATIDRSPK